MNYGNLALKLIPVYLARPQYHQLWLHPVLTFVGTLSLWLQRCGVGRMDIGRTLTANTSLSDSGLDLERLLSSLVPDLERLLSSLVPVHSKYESWGYGAGLRDGTVEYM